MTSFLNGVQMTCFFRLRLFTLSHIFIDYLRVIAITGVQGTSCMSAPLTLALVMAGGGPTDPPLLYFYAPRANETKLILFAS